MADRRDVHNPRQHSSGAECHTHSRSSVVGPPLLQVHLRVLKGRVQREDRKGEKQKKREKLLRSGNRVFLPQNQRTNRRENHCSNDTRKQRRCQPRQHSQSHRRGVQRLRIRRQTHTDQRTDDAVGGRHRAPQVRAQSQPEPGPQQRGQHTSLQKLGVLLEIRSINDPLANSVRHRRAHCQTPHKFHHCRDAHRLLQRQCLGSHRARETVRHIIGSDPPCHEKRSADSHDHHPCVLVMPRINIADLHSGLQDGPPKMDQACKSQATHGLLSRHT
mmetsp:Transcript_71535/g.163919  ORF Transcript_71535/g.163919 Transcript_71535/m.163919 type:complete len:274 (+) Transcript_71535:1350-2171(+)